MLDYVPGAYFQLANFVGGGLGVEGKGEGLEEWESGEAGEVKSIRSGLSSMLDVNGIDESRCRMGRKPPRRLRRFGDL
jgi:hypothetical protein